MADRVKFSSMVLLTVLWPLFVYVPICHMVWGGGLIGAGIGAVDFGGGYVVHISAGVSGLILCSMLGKRMGLGKRDTPAHNIPLVMIATGILWFGFFAIPELSGNGAGGLFVTGDAALLGQEALGLLIVYAWLALLVPILGLITKALCKGSLRVDGATEEAGLDTFYHEPGYPAFEGVDPDERQ